MSPRIYQLCREAVTFMAVQEAPLARRVAKAYVLFLIHLDVQDIPKEHQHHLVTLQTAFQDTETDAVGVSALSDSEADRLSRHAIDLFTGVADHYHGHNPNQAS